MEVGLFVPHCDDNHCNLGSFDYKCPFCRRNIMDLEAWKLCDDIFSGFILIKKCEYCEGYVRIFYNENDFTFYVEKENPSN